MGWIWLNNGDNSTYYCPYGYVYSYPSGAGPSSSGHNSRHSCPSGAIVFPNYNNGHNSCYSSPSLAVVPNHNGYKSNNGVICPTKIVVKEHCKTYKTEDGRFIKDCEKSEEEYRTCNGRPDELVKSVKYSFDEDITNLVTKASVEPGLGSKNKSGHEGMCSVNGTPQIKHGDSSSITKKSSF